MKYALIIILVSNLLSSCSEETEPVNKEQIMIQMTHTINESESRMLRYQAVCNSPELTEKSRRKFIRVIDILSEHRQNSLYQISEGSGLTIDEIIQLDSSEIPFSKIKINKVIKAEKKYREMLIKFYEDLINSELIYETPSSPQGKVEITKEGRINGIIDEYKFEYYPYDLIERHILDISSRGSISQSKAVIALVSDMQRSLDNAYSIMDIHEIRLFLPYFNFNKVEPIAFSPTREFKEGDSLDLRIFTLAYDSTRISEFRIFFDDTSRITKPQYYKGVNNIYLKGKKGKHIITGDLAVYPLFDNKVWMPFRFEYEVK